MALVLLLKQYCSLVSPNLIQFPEVPTLEFQEFLVKYILHNEHLQAFPPSRQYQKAFFKRCISHLERTITSEDDEINEAILKTYLDLLPAVKPMTETFVPDCGSQASSKGAPRLLSISPSERSFITHFWQYPPRVERDPDVDLTKYQRSTLLESRTTIESGTTGLRTWLAAFALSQYLIHNPGIVQGKTVLELGSGTGFLAIIVASLQILSASETSSSIWLTDVNDDVLSRSQNNVQISQNLSSKHPNIHYRNLDWNMALQYPLIQHAVLEEIHADLVLGSDVVFDPNLIPGLIATIKMVLDVSAPLILIALTRRNQETMNEFTFAAQVQGLAVDYLPELPIDFVNVAEIGADANNGVTIMKITLHEFQNPI